jgi:hypothetical protein
MSYADANAIAKHAIPVIDMAPLHGGTIAVRDMSRTS